VALAMAAGCGGGSDSGTGAATTPTKPQLTVNQLVATLNDHLQPDHFSIVHRFAGGISNVSSDGNTYGTFLVEYAPEVKDSTWGKDDVGITPGGSSGNFASFGFGGKGDCDYVKSYGHHLFVVYTFTTQRAVCGGTATPRGQGWRLVDETLTRLAQTTS
jgi:hypothetical protein